MMSEEESVWDSSAAHVSRSVGVPDAGSGEMVYIDHISSKMNFDIVNEE
jgi:hypothetical protein